MAGVTDRKDISQGEGPARQAISLALDQVNLQAYASDDARRQQVARALLLVMSSPDYLIQR